MYFKYTPFALNLGALHLDHSNAPIYKVTKYFSINAIAAAVSRGI